MPLNLRYSKPKSDGQAISKTAGTNKKHQVRDAFHRKPDNTGIPQAPPPPSIKSPEPRWLEKGDQARTSGKYALAEANDPPAR